MPTPTAATCPIDAYVADLDAALSGPRRVRTDLLAEARDGLVDAAEAYAAAGYPPDEAQRRAVADFGMVAAVAPAYRRELAAAQGWRTTLWVLLTQLTVYIEGNLSWRVVDLWHGQRPGPAYLFLAEAVDRAGFAIAGLLLAVLLGYRLLSRYVPVRALVRGIGGSAFALLGLLLVCGLILTLATPVASASAPTMALAILSILGPATVTGVVVGRGARRCLTLEV